MLFSIQKKRNQTENKLQFNVQPMYLSSNLSGTISTSNSPTTTLTSTATAKSIILGPLDAMFAQPNKRPTYVELLILFSSQLDPELLMKAISSTLSNFPAAVQGQREGLTMLFSKNKTGVRFSSLVGVNSKDFTSSLPSSDLFDTPTNGEVFTIRLSTDGHLSSVAIVFDHALSDVSGPSLFISHLSYHYTKLLRQHGQEKKQTKSSETSKSIRSAENSLPSIPPTPVLPPLPPLPPLPSSNDNRQHQSSIQTELPPELKQSITSRINRLKGGVACVQIQYSLSNLAELKVKYKARSRHEAAFTDLVLLLREHISITTATISRDDRQR